MTKIILLADGTGNAFLAQESNIWRIYQALDTSTTEQIAHYIKGVGTSSFRPWALFDGATGIGVPSNIRKLYRFLCWNYAKGDEIYMFGFSRGAFTIRTLIDFIANEGLLPTTIAGQPVTHAEMRRYSMAAWRSYCGKDPIRRQNLWVKLGVRYLRDAVLWGWRRLTGQLDYRVIQNHVMAQGRDGGSISITFAGLFDTVEAFGVPLEELRAAVHALVWPISFGNNYEISPQVEWIRHALSLDDERTTFHPIRVAQSTLPDKPSNRVREIWFSGVHSDVGGGYSDDATAYVPLVWMLEQAERFAPPNPVGCGLLLKDGALDGFRDNASAFDTLHDSRGGIGVLYRYDPRMIATDGAFGQPIMHHTVVERIVAGHNDYAPVVLPSISAAYMPDGSLYASLPGTGWQQMERPHSPPAPSAAPLIAARMTKALAAVNSLPAPPRPADLCIARNFVWRRRVNYFALIALLLTTLSLPLIGDWMEGWLNAIFERLFTIFSISGPEQSADGGFVNAIKGLSDALLSIAPPYLLPFVQSIVHHPWISLALIVSILFLWWRSIDSQDTIHDFARRAWSLTPPPPVRLNWLNALAESARKSTALGGLHSISTRILLPTIYSIIFIVMPVAVVTNRLWFNYIVGSGNVCIGSNSERHKPNKVDLKWIVGGEAITKAGYSEKQPDGFATNNPCWASGFAVERGAAYRLTINIDVENGDEPWFDQLIMTDVDGFESTDATLSLATLMRRWPSVAWFHPIARIGATGDEEWPLIPIGGDLPLSGRGEKCTQLPIRYDETKEHKNFCNTENDHKSCLALGNKLQMDQPLPRKEIAAALAAWGASDFTFRSKQCHSTFPRKVFVSDFVAQKTGELFLFVNDAVFFPPWDGTPQSFYKNNLGTASVTLQRAH